MPLPEVRELVETADDSKREETLRTHLERMEKELAHTREVVTSLRELLTPGRPSLEVEYRFIPAFRAYGVRGHVERDDIGPWCQFAFSRLDSVAGGIEGHRGSGIQRRVLRRGCR